jgi:hypothetical protein
VITARPHGAGHAPARVLLLFGPVPLEPWEQSWDACGSHILEFDPFLPDIWPNKPQGRGCHLEERRVTDNPKAIGQWSGPPRSRHTDPALAPGSKKCQGLEVLLGTT